MPKFQLGFIYIADSTILEHSLHSGYRGHTNIYRIKAASGRHLKLLTLELKSLWIFKSCLVLFYAIVSQHVINGGSWDMGQAVYELVAGTSFR